MNQVSTRVRPPNLFYKNNQTFNETYLLTVPLTISYSPIPVSDWLTFCCGNLILIQKKNAKMIKTQFF